MLSQVLPQQKGEGAGKVLTMVKGGTEVLAMLKGRGHKKS